MVEQQHEKLALPDFPNPKNGRRLRLVARFESLDESLPQPQSPLFSPCEMRSGGFQTLTSCNVGQVVFWEQIIQLTLPAWAVLPRMDLQFRIKP